MFAKATKSSVVCAVLLAAVVNVYALPSLAAEPDGASVARDIEQEKAQLDMQGFPQYVG
jgi:hypothetical protein